MATNGPTPKTGFSFEKYHDKLSASGITARTHESRAWFFDKLKGLSNIDRTKLLNDHALNPMHRPLPGRMFMFFYDPKGKKQLPYYDRFPLIIMVGKAKGGFYGLNLHYLPNKLRAIFFDKLLSFTNNNKYDETTKFKLTYNMLRSAASLKYFAPCFKHYLFSHLSSVPVEVPSTDWEIAVCLPTWKFVGDNNTSIWKESLKQF
jgi:hypothetical protein